MIGGSYTAGLDCMRLELGVMEVWSTSQKTA